MKYFLSIDMDFFDELVSWNSCSPAKFRNKLFMWLAELYVIACKRQIPFNACMNHQQMLNAVNNSSVRVLKNYDLHSDVCILKRCYELGCGNWVNYVRWRKNGTYIWCRSCSYEEGDCGLDFASRKERKMVDWGKIITRKITKTPRPSSLVSGASEIWVCMSPAYTAFYNQEVFRHFIKEYKVPYRKGTISECNSRSIKPPFRHIRGNGDGICVTK